MKLLILLSVFVNAAYADLRVGGDRDAMISKEYVEISKDFLNDYVR